MVFANRLFDRLRGAGQPAYFLLVDGKPLLVGTHTKDREARRGRVRGGFARGDKLHVIWGDRALPEAWAVTGLNEYEGAVAERMLAEIHGCGYLLGDGNYEANRLYDAAAESGYQLVAPPDERDTGLGHRYQSPYRLRALGMFGCADRFGEQLMAIRAGIERQFGNLTSFGGGLSGLPSWVRTLGRVTRWVWAKLLINAARILNRDQTMQPLQ